MALPYSDDLRSRILEAYEAGAGSLSSLAAQFRVSWGYSKKIRMQQLRSGDKQRPVQQRHGPASRITSAAQEQVCNWVRAQPDLTEAELCALLSGIGVSVSRSRVGQLLRRMGLRLKKNAARQ
jgi:transposase